MSLKTPAVAKRIRLITALRKKFPDVSRMRAQKLALDGDVLVNGKSAKPNAWVLESDVITIQSAQPMSLKPNPDVACRLIGSDRDYLFLEKSNGVHSVAHDLSESESVANWLAAFDAKQTRLHALECGLAHRLDFETSGVMVAARHAAALEWLKDCFRDRAVDKAYVCLVSDTPPAPGIYDAFAENSPKTAKKIRVTATGRAKSATPIITQILSVKKESRLWRVTLKIITGYRHQIRAHLAFLGCPIVGDKLYKGSEAKRLMLHATEIAFTDSGGRRRGATSKAPF